MSEKRPTIYDIAEACGVSAASVSYVINNKKKVSPQTKEKVLQAMEEMGYAIDRAASNLSSGRSSLVGVCFPLNSAEQVFSDNPFYSEFLASFEKEMSINGYDVIVGYIQETRAFEHWLQTRRLDGVVMFGLYSDETIEMIAHHRIPFVLTDVYNDIKNVCKIRVDDEKGGYLAGKFLYQNGHRNVAFLGGSLSKSKVDARRYNGLCSAAKEHGARTPTLYETSTTFEGGYQMAKPIAESIDSLSAVMCGSDIVAIGLMRHLQEMGIAIPEKLSVIGFDDLKECTYVYPALTTIRQDIARKGQFAAEALLEAIKYPEAIPSERVLEPELIVRNSTKKMN